MKISILIFVSMIAAAVSAERAFGEILIRPLPVIRAVDTGVLPSKNDCPIKLETEDTANPNLIKLKWEVPCPSVTEAYLYGPFSISPTEEPEKQDLLVKEDGTADAEAMNAGVVCDASNCRDFDAGEFEGAAHVMKVGLPTKETETSGSAFAKMYLPKNEFVLVVHYGADAWKTVKATVERPLPDRAVIDARMPVAVPEGDTAANPIRNKIDAANNTIQANAKRDILGHISLVTVFSLKDAGNHQCPNIQGNAPYFQDCLGTLNLDAAVFPPQPALPISLYSRRPEGDHLVAVSQQASSSGHVIFMNVHRDHDHYQWVAKAGSLTSAPFSMPYVANFVMSNLVVHSSYDCDIQTSSGWDDPDDACDHTGPGSCNTCPYTSVSDCRNFVSKGSFHFTGRHLKSISSDCGGSFTPQPVANDYGDQAGDWSVIKVNKDGFNCTITAIGNDGQPLTGSIVEDPWHDNCGGNY